MPKLTLYDVWPLGSSPAILIAGDREIHSLFIQKFSTQYRVQISEWTPKQEVYDYGFYVNGASEEGCKIFEDWLDKYSHTSPISISNKSLDKGYALSLHGGKIKRLVRKAKLYRNESATPVTQKAAIELVEIMIEHLDCLENTDYFVAVPSLGKTFDLPKFLTEELCVRGKFRNGNAYLKQVREKQHFQKDLDDIEDKRYNVRDIFKLKNDHPFSGRVVTIIDDIYRSGTTIDEVAKVIRASGARIVQAFVLTKTFRD